MDERVPTTGRAAREETAASEQLDGRPSAVELSAVVTVRDPGRTNSMRHLYLDYRRQLEKTGRSFEFVFVLEGDGTEVLDELRRLKDERGDEISILVFARSYGDSTVLNAGFEHAAGDLILTLPAYHQVEPDVIPELIGELDRSDMAVVRRRPRVDRFVSRVQVRVFHAILRGLLGFEFHDLGCAVRAFRAEILETVQIYGDQHRFFPVLTSHYGYTVTEIEAPQTEHDTFQTHLSLDANVNRALDLLSIAFLTTFTKKPLRFFGVPGIIAVGGGLGLTLYLTYQRIFLGEPLADRPLLLLGILIIVLGTVFFSIGLIGEMIIFTNADETTEYTIDEVIE